MIKLLISEGGVLDISDDDDNTPLHLACRSVKLKLTILQNDAKLLIYFSAYNLQCYLLAEYLLS